MSETLIVNTAWLQEHLHDANLRIVDIRGHVAPPTDPQPHYFNHRADYDISHIAGAVFIDWVREITDPDDPQHAQLAKPNRFAQAMSRAGIGNDTFVVAYDDAQGMFAARLWLALNYYGHSHVAVLDGGWQKWLTEQAPVTDTIPAISLSQFDAKVQPNWVKSANDVFAVTNGTHEAKLLDARSPAEFQGQVSRARRKGHIPGALSLPRTALMQPDGTLLPAEALRTQFASLGVNDSSSNIICYCNGGVSASYELLALRRAGFKNSTVYDGSWKEWGNDDTRPIE